MVRFMKSLDPTAASFDEWRDIAEASIDGRRLDSLDRNTEDGFAVKALYSAADLPEALPNLGQPGWVVAQELEPARDAATLNRMLLEELSGGAGRVDLPARTDPLLLADALTGVEVGAAGFGFAPGSDWRQAGEMLLRLGRTGDSAADSRPRDSLGADPVLPALHAGEDESDALAGWMGQAGPELSDAMAAAIAGDEYHQLGLTPAQELAVVLASTTHVLRRFEACGIAPAATLGRMEWRFAGEADLYGTIAKTRALAVLLHQLVEAVGGETGGIGQRIHGITSNRHLSRLDPETNILRNGTALLGMALGGAGIITARPHDWLTGASPAALRLARNAQHLLAAEGRLAAVADPASGSYFIEGLTRDLALRAWKLFQKLEASGGIVKTTGMVGQWAADAVEARGSAVNEGREKLLGVTAHPGRRDSSGIAGLVEGAFGLRGGPVRPSADWEELRARAVGAPLRCLLMDVGGDGKAGGCRRWFQAVGLEPVAMQCATRKEAEAAIASAHPDILVLDGAGEPDSYRKAAGKGCRIVPAGAFGGNCRDLMRELLDTAVREGA